MLDSLWVFLTIDVKLINPVKSTAKCVLLTVCISALIGVFYAMLYSFEAFLRHLNGKR